ncbi:MAG: UbiA-like polyprenyltransferase [bacterium]
MFEVLRSKIVLFGRMIRFPHTVFALPFALVGMLLATKLEGHISFQQILWIVVASVGARTAAMGFNRLVDRELDARNPRTRDRELPTGRVSIKEAVALVATSSALFVFAASMLNPLCLALSPLALAIVFLYSYTKRFTWGTHLFLGLSLSIAPIGAWIAIRGSLDLPPLILGGGVVLWVAGFDIIYATQDYDFDIRAGLHSIPRAFGIPKALWIARGFHSLAFGFFLAPYFVMPLGVLYLIGVLVIGAFLIYEHILVKPNDLSKVDVAFFTMNGAVSLVFLAFVLTDFILSG